MLLRADNPLVGYVNDLVESSFWADVHKTKSSLLAPFGTPFLSVLGQDLAELKSSFLERNY